MKIDVFLALASLFLPKGIESKNWALLVAGSNSYDNYRHQADICHAYHIVRDHGVPAENIVTMMYDDIAYNNENPVQGNVINHPDGPNVYPGVVIDYKKEDVNPKMFLAVLSGNKTRVHELTNGRANKVIDSGPDDHVFVNFADHGAPGILAFPDDELQAQDLFSTLKEMHENNKYKKLVFYVEACESGSMFSSSLPDTWNIYATTAANPDESSYACYFDDKRQTYLGDVYSVNWMEDSDKENLKVETLQKQFKITKEETNTSHVMEYGDMTIGKMTVAEFQGSDTTEKKGLSPRSPLVDAVPAPDVPLMILKKKLAAAKTLQQRREISQKIDHLLAHNSAVEQLFAGTVEWLNKEAALTMGQHADSLFVNKPSNIEHFSQAMAFKDLLMERRPITNWGCYSSAIDTLKFNCANLRLSQDYHALKHLYLLVNLCERGDFADFQIRTAIMASASKQRALCGVEGDL